MDLDLLDCSELSILLNNKFILDVFNFGVMGSIARGVLGF
jgi:hypothetical protein